MHLYIGSQGEVNEAGELTQAGTQAAYGVSMDAESVRQSLFADHVVLFAPDHGAGLQTARLIAEDLEEAELVSDAFAESISLFPSNVRDIHQFIGIVLNRRAIETEGPMVLFVAHKRLTAAVADPLPAGDNVHELPPGWQNPYFIPEFAVDPTRPDLRPW